MRKSDGTILGGQNWSPVKIGGLGYVVGGVIASDGSWELCWADVGDLYTRETTANAWTPRSNAAGMGAGVMTPLAGSGGGIYGGDIAGGNVSVAYGALRGRMVRSTNRGVSWTDDSLNGTTGVYQGPNDQNGSGSMRFCQHKIVCDPFNTNGNVCYAGFQSDGLWRRLSTGWAKVTSVPNSTFGTDTAQKIVIVAVDNTSATTGSSPDIRRSVVYAAVSGQGLYKSTDGGGTFALVTGHPGAGTGFLPNHMVVDQTGKIWLCLNTGAQNNVYTSSNGGTTWTNITTTPAGIMINVVEVDPKNSSRIVGNVGSGSVLQSVDGGTTWTQPYFPIQNKTVQVTSCPIVANDLNQETAHSSTIANANVLPHPTLNKDRLWGGFGVYYIPTPWPAYANNVLVLVEETAGIEELVTYHIDIHPDGTTWCCAGDRGLVLQNPDRTSFALMNYPQFGLTDCSNCDYAIDNHNYKVTTTYRIGLTDTSGFSTDGGKTWTPFPTQINPSGNGGHIAISNTNQIVAFQIENQWPRYSHDGGNTWTKCTFSGFTTVADGTENGWGFGSPFGYRRHIVCADKSNAGVFYAYNYGVINGVVTPAVRGVWKSTDGGVTWTHQGDPGLVGGVNFFGFHSGLIITPNGHLFLFTGPVSDSTTEDAGVPSYRSEDGGVTWTQLGQVNEVNHLAWGAPPPNATVPYTLYGLAWLSHSFTQCRSFDKGVTWQALANYDTFDWPSSFAADPVEFGRTVMGGSGTGFAECRYNFPLTLS